MQVFITHSHADAALAARISGALERSGLHVWNPDSDLMPGDNWAAERARALEESEAMIVLLTPTTMSSPWVKREIEYALGAKNYANRLIPVVVGDRDSVPANEVPWIVRRMPWVGLEDSDSDTPRVDAIAKAIRSHA